MNLYISVYHHRHGEDVIPIFSEQEPTHTEMVAAWEKGNADLELDREDEHLECRGPFSAVPPAPSLNKKKCDDAGCPGWAIFNDGEIQRCDTCKRFESDDEAITHVMALEAIDISRHLDVAAHRALVEIREEMSGLIESTQDYPASSEMTEIINRLEVLLGRSFWLERHRWAEHSLQFARLLSELYAIGEESEDTETMTTPGFLSVKIVDLCESMSLDWTGILSIFERADKVFQSEKTPPEVKS